MTARGSLVCSLLLFTGSVLLHAGESLPSAAQTLMSSPYVARGDTEGQMHFWISQARKRPGSPLTELALRLALRLPVADLPRPDLGSRDVRSLLGSRGHTPMAEDVARRFEARALAMAGKRGEAQALHAARSLVPAWWVIGPFGRHAHANFYTIFPPEHDVDLTAKHEGTAQLVSWRRLLPSDCWPAVDAWLYVHPHTGVVYLLAQFRLSKAQALALHADTACAYELFIDDARLARVDPLATETSREHIWGPGRLDAGWHRLLIKLYATSGERGFALRLLDKSLRPLKGVQWEDRAVVHPVAPGPAPTLAGRSVPALGALRAALPESQSHAGLAAALAAFCLEQGLLDEGVYYARLACAQDKRSPWFATLRGQAEQAATHLPEAQRENAASAAFAQATMLQADFAPALLGLAEHERARKHYREALELCSRILEHHPRCLEALRLRASIATDLDWIQEARAWTQALCAAHPHALATAKLETHLAAKLGDHARLVAAYGRIAAADQSDPLNGLAWARALARGQRAAEARAAIQAVRRAHPGRADVAAAASRIYGNLNDAKEALAAMRRAVELLPDAPQYQRDLGDLLALSGAGEDALAAYQSSLTLQPDQHGLRRLLAHLGGDTSTFWSPYAQDPFAALKASVGLYPDGNTVRLIDQAVISVYPDGSYAALTHELQKILHRGGIQDAGTVNIYGELLEARTIRADGSVQEPVRLPSSNRLTMPDLDKGAAVDYKYLTESYAQYDRVFRFPKWYFRSPDTEEEFIFSHIVVRVPKGFPLVYATRNFGNAIEFNQKTDGNTITYEWTGRNMKQAIHEPGSPHIDEMLPFIEFGSRRSWQDINHLMMNAYLGRLRLTRDLQALAKRLTAGVASPRERIARLHAFVCHKIEHRTGPLQASAILAQRAGDRNILLMALLRAAGFDPIYAPARPRRALLHEPTWEIPQAGHFPLRLLAVPLQGEETLWLDTRYASLGCGELLEDVAGATAFLVGEDAGTFRTVPPRAPQAYAVQEERTLHVPPGTGPLRIVGRRTIRGEEGHKHKQLLRDASERQRRNRLEDFLADSIPGATTIKLELPGLHTNDTPFQQHYEVTVEGLRQRRQQQGWALPLCLTPLQLLPSGEDDPDNRQTPYHMRAYRVGEDTIILTLPATAQVRHLPRPVLERNAFGFYELRARRDGHQVRIQRRYEFSPQRIDLTNWPLFLHLARHIQQAEAQVIEWTHAATPQPARAAGKSETP